MVSRVERAKQFLPFDALKGLQEALKEKKKELEFAQRIDLVDEVIEKISEKLQMLELGNVVVVKYYCNKSYKEVIGKVRKVDRVKKKLVILVGNEEVSVKFSDILKLRET